MIASDPIVSCDEARELERRLFAGGPAAEWAAMQRAGAAVGAAALRDNEEIGGLPADGHVLVLVGKGHNGGDALLAAKHILEKHPLARADVLFVFGERTLRPLAARAWRSAGDFRPQRMSAVRQLAANARYDLCLDGIFGFQFRPPADARVAGLIEQVNALPIRVRAAVDLPSAGLFRADFTYATGAVKTPALDAVTAGRIRYLDLGFFDATAAGADRVLKPAVLAPLAALRSSSADKRTYGHLLVVAGSRRYPGAVLMSVLAALRSGAGLVTAVVPETLAPAFAAQAPEAMWIGAPETSEGGLALEGLHCVRERIDRVTALVIGSGLGREPETLTLVGEVLKLAQVPAVLDADALQPDLVRAARGPLVLTPHAGEFKRIAGDASLERYADETGATVILKGPITRIAGRDAAVYRSFFGGPVLARGGSGDLLAGLTGGLLAQSPDDPPLAAARGVVWHGLAADALARAHGQVAVRTTQLLEFLPTVLRELGRGADTTF